MGTISGTSADKVKFGGEMVVNITLEYRTVDTTSLAKIQNAVALFQTAFELENSTHVAAINNLINEGVGGYTIVVDYEEDASVTGLRPTNNNTIKVSKAWLDTNPTFNANTLRNVLNSMLIWVDPAPAPMIGKAPVPQYNRAMQLRDNRISI